MEIRNPVKKTAIAKKEKIIEKGFELICEKGYHHVTCVDIAKYAGVSTGIIYQYFKDKHDIMLLGVKDYSSKILFPMFDIIKYIKKENLEESLRQIIESFIKNHRMSKEAHRELLSLAESDQEVASLFRENELILTNNTVAILKENGMLIENMSEKIHLIIGLIDQLCHEIVYHNHPGLDYKIMKEEVIKMCLFLINDEAQE